MKFTTLLVTGLLTVVAAEPCFAGTAPVLDSQGSVNLLRQPGNPNDFVAAGSKPSRQKGEFSDIAGRHMDWLNEYGHSAVDFDASGDFTYNDDNGAQNIDGMWWIDPVGRLCLTSTTYWRFGACFVLRGSSTKLTAMSPTKNEDIVYPITLSR